jgi:hypothetical protein
LFMKFTTRNGHEVAIGNPDYSFAEHLQGHSHKLRIVSGAVGGVAALAGLSKRGEGVSRRLGVGAAKIAAGATALDALSTVHSSIRSLRRAQEPEGVAEDTTDKATQQEVSLDELRDQIRTAGSEARQQIQATSETIIDRE